MLQSLSSMSSTNGNSRLNLVPSLKSNKGFATLLLLTLTPLILALTIGFWGFCQLLSLRQSFDDLCRSSILSIQAQNSLPLHQLMRLNPMAESLIRQKKRAYKRLALGVASKNPIMVAKAKTKLAELSLRQIKLAQSQQVLKVRARSMALTQGYNYQRVFLKKLSAKNSSHRIFMELSFKKLKLPSHRWAVRATAPTELASPYEHLPYFAKNQIMTASWEIHVAAKIARLLGTDAEMKMGGKCQATLLKERKYPSVLVEDKF